MQRASLSLLIFLAGCLAAGPVYATACSNPTTIQEGDIIYNSAYHTYQFCNGINWVAMGAAGGNGGGPVLISTQTASSSASLQFTNLPTSYNTLFLNCSGLAQSALAPLRYYVGEGSTPTWETGANYTQTGNWVCAGSWNGNGIAETATATDLMGNGTPAAGASAATTMYIYNVGSSSLYKYIIIANAGASGTPPDECSNFYTSYWNADTNPITGIEIIPTSGNITSGTCSLYGMN